MHGVLYLAPGAVAAFFGLIILARARSVTRGPVGFAGLVVAACGAWFVMGPALWPTFGTGPVFTPASTAMDSFINQGGYNLGVGVILAVLGGMALKALARDREVPVEGRQPYDERMRGDTTPPEGEPAAGERYAGDRGPVDATRQERYAGDRVPVDATRQERVAAGGEAVDERRTGDPAAAGGVPGGGRSRRQADGERSARGEAGVPGDKVPGDPVQGDKVRGDEVRGDQVRRDRVPGDEVGEDRVAGDHVGEEEVRNEQVADDRVPVGGGPSTDRPAGDGGNQRRGVRRLFSR
jgi:hypothetical protein